MSIKFFEKSKALFKDGTTVSDRRGQNANSILNHSRDNGWLSKDGDSNDTIMEQIVIDLPELVRIDTIILNQHNFKDVRIYILASNRMLTASGGVMLTASGGEMLIEDSGEAYVMKTESGDNMLTESGGLMLMATSGYVDQAFARFMLTENGDFMSLEQNPMDKMKTEQFAEFDAIPGTSALRRTLIDTDIDKSTSIFQFPSTRCSRIIVETTATQTANQRKSLKSILATNEIGTFNGNPQIRARHDKNKISLRAISGKNIVIDNNRVFKFNLNLNNFSDQSDVDLLEALFNAEDGCLVWLSGGFVGTSFFTTAQPGFELDDIYLVKVVSELPADYVNSTFVNPVLTQASFVEVVG